MNAKFSRYEKKLISNLSIKKIQFSRKFSLVLILAAFSILIFGPFISSNHEVVFLAILLSFFGVSIFVVTKHQELILKVLNKEKPRAE